MGNKMYNPNMAPGIATGQSFSYRALFRGNSILEFPGGIIVDGSESRDPRNTGDTDILRPGLIMGVLTSGLFAPTIVGPSTVAYTSGALSLTVSTVTAAELYRRLNGVAGTLTIVGPPTAAGTVAEIDTTLSGINLTTGVLTITNLGANMISGAFVTVKDGSHTPLGMLFKPDGLKVTNPEGDDIDVQTSLAIGGTVDSSQIVDWPSDASLKGWVVDKLNSVGQFVFDHPYL